jgi:hypothetical protein
MGKRKNILCDCGLPTKKVYSQLSTGNKAIGYICPVGHFWPTKYGKSLLSNHHDSNGVKILSHQSVIQCSEILDEILIDQKPVRYIGNGKKPYME